MSDHVNQNSSIIPQKVVQNAVITHPEFEQSRKIISYGLRSDLFNVLRQPIESFQDSLRYWRVKAL